MLAVLMSLVALATPAPVAAQSLRKSINQLTPAEVQSLRRGVAVMMSRNTAPRNSADFRRSWVYWANAHAHFGASCRGAITGGSMSGVKTWKAANAKETATWCTCEHGTLQFLTWHRMFLYYFERVLQQAAKDPALRLPYWDYASDAKLPAVFRDTTYLDDTGATVANPLRVTARKPALNNGTAGLAATVTSSRNAMAATSYQSFSSRLEQGPHGPVHCAIAAGGCPNGLMGSVPASALDPIFYLHHANIDRLYDCWLQVDEAGRLPDDPSVLGRQYSFVDSDGSVKKRTVRDMLRPAQLGYGYAAGGGCPAYVAATLVAQAPSNSLGAGESVAPLSVESVGAPQPAARGAAPAPTVTVIVEGLTVAKVPGVLYAVYLANADGERAQIGVVDFFGFDGGGGGHAHGGHGESGRRFEFDATAAVRLLGIPLDSRPQLVFVPITGLTDSTPEAAARAVPADADIKFRSARLRIERPPR
jgi:hypothetical protein